MMDYVFDSSALIYLGKARVLEHIPKIKGSKLISPAVYEEVVMRGFERGDPEAGYIDGLIKEKHFSVAKPKNLIKIPSLSRADNEVLSLAKERNAVALIDEIYARDIADSLGIGKHGSIWVVLILLKQKVVTRKEAMKCLDIMVSHGFYLSITMYREVEAKIGKL